VEGLLILIYEFSILKTEPLWHSANAMKFLPSSGSSAGHYQNRSSAAVSPTLLVALVAFALGAAVGAFWVAQRSKATEAPAPVSQLSGATQDVLNRLGKPVALRFYSLLDPGASSELRAFSDRVKLLLLEYQQNAVGKIDVAIMDNTTNTSPNQALADGIAGFNLDRGEGCYLGVALSCDGRKEVLPRLLPEWETALEPDLSRAIANVSKSRTETTTSQLGTPEPATTEMLKKTIPDASKVSLEEGTRMLRTAALAEFTATVNETQTQVQAAEAQWKQAKSSGSPDEQDAALKHLQDIQNVQSQKLKEITARSQAEIDAWKKLKASGP
jgi:hypothetical protein